MCQMDKVILIILLKLWKISLFRTLSDRYANIVIEVN